MGESAFIVWVYFIAMAHGMAARLAFRPASDQESEER